MVGHSDVAPGRKTDPGAAFDWPRLGRLLGAAPTGGRAAGRLTARPRSGQPAGQAVRAIGYNGRLPYPGLAGSRDAKLRRP